jgi:hypothetical protein
LDDIFWRWTSGALGWAAERAEAFIRKAWPTNGAPSWRVSDDIVFLRVTPVDDMINRQMDFEYAAAAGGDLSRRQTYTRVHAVNWVVYGPGGYESAERIRRRLFSPDPLLRRSQLFVALDIPAPNRLPELHSGKWWERSDLTARFNEFCRVETPAASIAGAGIRLYTEKGRVT